MAAPDVFDAELRARVVGNLANWSRHTIPTDTLRPAAVALTLLVDEHEQPCFLLTRRASGLTHHRGQFALPGGRVDLGESVEEAALRELSEELGIGLQEEAVLGRLDDFRTRSGFVITPVVLWGEGRLALRPNPHEVAHAYRVPLRELYRPEVPLLSPTRAGQAPILSLPLVGTQVFTPTAAIIYQLREVALEGRSTRVHHYEQPLFAWK